MGYAIKKVAKVAVTLALGSVLVACGGGQSESDSAQGSGGGTGITASVEGEWLSPCDYDPVGNKNYQTSLRLSQTFSSQLNGSFNTLSYVGSGCTGSPTPVEYRVAVLTLQQTNGLVLTVQAVGVTPQKVKVVDSGVTYWAWIALKDAQTLGYLEGAQSATERYPTLADDTGSNLQVWTRVVTP